MKTTSSSTTQSTSEKSVSKSTGGQQSSVVISEVNSNIDQIDDGSLRGMQTHYVVTQPENVPQPPKEHYILGGTKIVEVGTINLGSDLAREKNQSSWNGKFVTENAPERTVLKSWTTQETTTNPSSSTVTTTTTKEEFVKTGSTGDVTTKRDVSTESSKLVSDTMKKQTDAQLKSDRTMQKPVGISGSDLLLESERCIAKKAYVTTNKDEQNTHHVGSSTSNIDNQIISNTTLFDTKSTNKTSSDSKVGDRYPISTTVPSRSKDIQDAGITSSSLLKSNDNNDRHSTEQYSQSFSMSSRTERSSSSNKVIEIVDGKEKVVSDSFNESGSMQKKSSQEKYQAKFGTDIKSEVEYDQKVAEENIKFSTDKPDKVPIFDREYHDSHRNIKQTGDNAPAEYLKGSYETTRYDDKTKEYVTDVQHHENNRLLDHTSTTSDAIQTKYDVGTSRLNVDSHIGATNQVAHIATDVQSTFNTSLNDRFNASTTHTANVSSSNDFIHTAKSDSIDSKSTAYTAKVFDNQTNTWKVVDESNTSEVNKRSTTQKPNEKDRRQSPSKYIDSKYTTESIVDKNVTTDSKSIRDHKTLHDKVTSIDKTARTDTKSLTKTTNAKISQHLYDEKTKSWREVDEKTIKSKRPSLIRYVSKDNEGKFTTIYKRKLFDKRSGQWKVVDEKVYRNNNFNEHIPEVIEDVTNVTTTTYTTKVYDTKTNTWRVVDEQTFTDQNTTVPKDIADEIARDQPDIANITTTTELTKVSQNFRCFLYSLARV